MSLFFSYDWLYDAAGRMLGMEIDSADYTDTSVDYTHDDTNQLTDAVYASQTDEDYEYDANGNRDNDGYTTGLHNRLTFDGTYTYEYDGEGNRTRRYDDSGANPADITEYEWDHRNRLVKVTARDTQAGDPTQVVEYYYDHANRWIRKLFNPGEQDERSTVFIYDNNQIVLQFDKTGSGDAADTDLSHRYRHAVSTGFSRK